MYNLEYVKNYLLKHTQENNITNTTIGNLYLQLTSNYFYKSVNNRFYVYSHETHLWQKVEANFVQSFLQQLPIIHNALETLIDQEKATDEINLKLIKSLESTRRTIGTTAFVAHCFDYIKPLYDEPHCNSN